MAKQAIIGVRGLYTSPNRLELPPGALSEATNLMLRRPGLAETRVGFKEASGSWVSIADQDGDIVAVWVVGGQIYALIHIDGATLAYAASVAFTTPTSLGSFAAPSGSTSNRIRTAEAKSCLYFTSSAGVYRMDAGDATPVLSGVQKPISISTAVSVATGAGFSAPGAVAYRATLVFKDARSNVHESAPSMRGLYRWSGATDAVDVTVRIPASLSTSYLIRLYRSAQVTAEEDEPSDEMGLVYERYLTSAEVTAAAVTISDIVPDEMRGATGYFCPSQEGIGQSNERPPLAKDICWHKDTLFYSGTTSKHRLTLRLISVSGTNGIAANDTVTIAGVTYTAVAAGATGDQFNLETGFTSDQANVQAAAINLVNTINASANNSTVYAYYLSGPDDPAGIILIEERGLGGSSFAATSAAGAANCSTSWAPELPTSGTTVSSVNDDAPNRIYFSKPGQPEAVPLLNYVDVGSKSDGVMRIARLRDSLYVFKEGEGIFRLVGQAGAFAVREHDATVRVRQSDKNTVASLGNQLYVLSDQGVVAVSDVGVRIVSGPIEESLRTDVLAGGVGSQPAHAIGNETLGYYALWLGTATGSEAWVYWPAANGWTYWDIDAAYSVIGRSSPSTSAMRAYITRADERKIRWQLVSDQASDYEDDNAVAISTALGWAVQTAQNPTIHKQWTRADFLLQDSTVTALTAGFSTELTTSEQTVSLAPASGAYITTSPVPLPTQLGAFLNVTLDSAQNEKRFVCGGLVLTYEEGGDHAGR